MAYKLPPATRKARKRAKKHEIMARRKQVLDLYLGGRSFREIGSALQISHQMAHADVLAVCQEVATELHVGGRRAVAVEDMRLDGLLRAVWPLAMGITMVKQPDGTVKPVRGEPNLKAVDRVIAISARRSRLLGLDAPKKMKLDVQGTATLLWGFDPGAAFPDLPGAEPPAALPAPNGHGAEVYDVEPGDAARGNGHGAAPGEAGGADEGFGFPDADGDGDGDGDDDESGGGNGAAG
jgi:hypothetical protein